MSSDGTIRIKSSWRGLLFDCALLSAAILVTLIVVGLVASRSHGAVGWWAAVTAGGLSWLGAMLALSSTRFFKADNQVNQALFGILAGMAFRMGLPLFVGLLMLQSGGELVEAGVVGMVFVFYFVTLVVETPMMLRQGRPLPDARRVS